MSLKNTVAVITGGGSGLGAGIGERFAYESAKVVLLDIQKELLEKETEKIISSGYHCSWIETNVTNKESVLSAFEKIKTEYGRIDVLINCAGISRIIPFLECGEDVWDLTMDVNVKGMFFTAQAAAPMFMDQKSGVIINFSSQSGKVGTSSYQAYCASKAGVIGLTQSLAIELAPYQVRVNSICPGVVITPMWDKQVDDYAAKRNLKREEVMPYFASKIPLGRIGTIKDVANLAVFLASDESSYITGQAINVSGGQVMF